MISIILRLIAKGVSSFMTIITNDESSARGQSNEFVRRRTFPLNNVLPSIQLRFPEKMNKVLGTKRMASLLTCLMIVGIPFTCIFFGLAISNYVAPSLHAYSDRDVIVDVTRLNYTWYNSHNITINLVGGLGNQMFQYAALVGVGRANGLKPVIDGRRNKIVSVFGNLKCTMENDVKRLRSNSEYSVFLERKSNAFESKAFSLNFMKNIQMTGFFQSWRYFDYVRSDVKNQFSNFGSKVTKRVNDFFMSIRSSYAMLAEDHVDVDEVRFVGVHVRRGDFLDPKNVEKGYSVADVYFYKRAMQFFVGKFKNVIFIVCSDDPVWTTENIHSSGQGSLVVHSKFSNLTNPAYDMKVLAHCNHTIFSGSSFGWWGAWLAGGIVVYSQEFPRPYSSLYDQFRLSDYFMPQWLPM